MFALGIHGAAYCAQISQIELADGSTIKGEVVSLENGVYTVNTESMGQIKLEASRIKKIVSPSGSVDANKPTEIMKSINPDYVQSQVDQLTPAVTGNEEVMNKVSTLSDDPNFQEVMKDPEILNAIKAKDIKALMNNEKFMKLLNNPTVKEIEKMLQ